MIKWLTEWWKETKRQWNDPNFVIRKGGFNDVSGKSVRPPPPKGQGLPSGSQMELTIKTTAEKTRWKK